MWEKGVGLVERLRAYYFGKKESPPAISEKTALLYAILFTVIFVAPFYLSKTLRTTPLNSRDSPTVIRARVRAVGLSCLASTVLTVFVLVQYGHASPRDVLRLFGMWPFNPLDCLKVLLLVMVLYTGPLYETIFVDGGIREFNLKAIKETLWDSPTSNRNVVIAPWAEELVFRSLVISLYLLAKVSPIRIVFVTPLVFGVAHVHHLIEFVQSHTPPGRTLPTSNVLLMGIVRSLFQFAYTSLFGFFTAFVYLRTGNVFASITAHMFCNYMGLPRVWGKVGQVDDWDITPDVAQGKRDDTIEHVRVGNSVVKDTDENEAKAAKVLGAGVKNLGSTWTVAYYLLLVVGAFGFYRLLFVLTESKNALATFS
ncbi:hypothetical protein M409DRAFT_69948 [Zasmidium cellare ATCC 36951]|uniref:intramembrane prenyl-peptidase Rce1 n=1 Tax=Zasmidium cellare ATCC 36951 TaxID=1080233 RepID=A0A6A6C5Q9_ZASCE|nr:uncharacterized protein M409DRAFT_69948 [Zasmidium cellare ATCC 36951]KAF2161079.1 hypothetical protein M409DRAFT_69948 [Zasmidium cellare ATCC 36951]